MEKTRRTLLIVLILLAAIPMQSNNRTILLCGHVKDAFTNGGIKNVKITLLDENKVPVDSQTVQYYNEDKSYMDSYYKFSIPAEPKKYIIKAEHPDYETCYIKYDVKYVGRNESFEAPFHYMKHKIKTLQGKDLKDVVVKATRVKIVFKNDTVVYNADAFNLPNGSMLDELIRQLPGVKLTDSGEIYLNGKKVDNLMLQGEIFFKKDKQLALKNFPAYTVKNVSFYDKMTDRSKYLGYNNERKEFVMDVKLKKEYSKGYIANAEGGYGTHNRYTGRLFGLRYTPHSRFTLFGNFNNLNQECSPGSDGEWNPRSLYDGVSSIKTVGMYVFSANKEETVKNDLTASVKWDNSENNTRTVASTFLPTNENYVASSQNVRGHGIYSLIDNELTISKPFYISSSTGWMYYNCGSWYTQRSVTYNKSPFHDNEGAESLIDRIFKSELQPIDTTMVNSMQKDFDTHGYYSSLWQVLGTSKKLPWGDSFDVNMDATYTKEKSTVFNNYQIRYMDQNHDDLQNQYSKEPTTHFRYKAWGSYNIHLLNKWNIAMGYEYEQRYRHEIHDKYRLDWLDGWSKSHHIGDIPSTRDSLLAALDYGNSNYTWYHAREHSGLFHVFYDKDDKESKMRFDLNMNIINKYEKLRYQKASLDTMAFNRNWLFTPSVSFNYSTPKGMGLDMSYGTEINTPELAKKINVTDTTDPLARYRGNNDLKNSLSHVFHLGFRNRIASIQAQYNIAADFRIDRNLIGNAVTYNQSSGVYTYQPRNINGNWTGSVSNGFSMALDKDRLWNLENNASFNFNRNVDFVTLAGSADYQISKVNNIYVTDGLKLTMQKNKFRGALIGNMEWHNSVSLSDNFSTMNVFDFNYGMTATYVLPLNIGISTDLKMYSRRGYSESVANNNYLIWNMSLSRSFIKNKLDLRVTGYDLLQKISNHSFVVNGQGRTETFYNSIPSYVMLTIGYKISVNPR
ncbi:outer membrane beta-barrel protein [Prevotella herbatica]|nr:outer membrane beta-barrel protein [Prevotella herbatica]